MNRGDIMDNISINILAPNVKDIKLDKSNMKSSESHSKDNSNTFESQLSKVKSKSTKVSKSILKNNVKDIAISKSIDLKELDKAESKESVNNLILTLINNILEIPIENINQILEKMNITPQDLLDVETFKSFLAHVYPEYDENQLLFNGEKLKDISKLFVKFEQISDYIEGEQNTIITQQLIDQNEVVNTTVIQARTSEDQPQENKNFLAASQSAVQIVQDNTLSKEQIAKNINAEEAIPEGNFSEEGLLNFKQMGLGMNVPIQAFNSAVNARLMDAQNTKANFSQFMQDTSITNQIINKIDISSLGSLKEITMELSPKELGNLSVKLTETNGVLVAHIRVDNEKTRELLLTESAQLEQSLEKQGLSVSEVRVDVRQNEHHSQMEQQKQKSTKRIQELINKHLSEAEENSMQVNEQTGELLETEVNYMV
jgi:flagellar hook-length control protein FliK